jgi:hypothetical protein
MTISSLMRSRAVLDAQISETPISIEKPLAAKWAVEERILSYRATTLGALRKQLRVEGCVGERTYVPFIRVA